MWASDRASIANVREHIAFDCQQKPVVACMVNAANDLRLFFCGPIGFVPGKNSRCVRNAFGVDFFMHGTGVDSCVADCLVPAWMAKTAKTPTMEIAFKRETILVDATRKLHDEPPQPELNYVKLNVTTYFLSPQPGVHRETLPLAADHREGDNGGPGSPRASAATQRRRHLRCVSVPSSTRQP